MKYLFKQGRFKLYEVEGSDGCQKGTTGNTYTQDTILLFESAESRIEIGKEIAWAGDELDAMDLADDITTGAKNISFDVQVSLAEKIVEDKKALMVTKREVAVEEDGTNASSVPQDEEALLFLDGEPGPAEWFQESGQLGATQR